MRIFLYIVAIWNFIVFLIYGIDKLKAIKNSWRISEKTLLISAFLLGGVGAFFGMRIWRHKTQHTSFKILVPIVAMLTIAILVFLLKQKGLLH